jgi:paraquat-inducible protein B
VRGLAVGAPVDFRGIPLGEVLSIEVELDAKTNEIRIPVEVVLFPDRLRARNRGDAAPQDPKAVVDALVAQGFRAQLRPGNLLTGQLFVTLDVFPNARKVAVDWSADPPVLPTVPGNLAQIEATLMSVAKKLDALPVEQIAAELRQSLASLDRLLASADKAVRRVDDKVAPEVAATLQETRETLAAAKRAMKAATDSTLAADSALQAEAREALRELTRAAQSLRSLTDYLERHPESLIRGKQEQPQ